MIKATLTWQVPADHKEAALERLPVGKRVRIEHEGGATIATLAVRECKCDDRDGGCRLTAELEELVLGFRADPGEVRQGPPKVVPTPPDRFPPPE